MASVHTHTPFWTDGTNGVSHAVGKDDRDAASAELGIRHWVVSCGAVAQYNGSSTAFFNIQRGALSTICNTVQ